MRVGASPGHHGDEIVPVHMEAFRHRVSWFHSQFAHGNAFRLVCGFHGDVAILVRIHVDRHFPGLGFAEPEFLLVVMTCLDRSFGEVAGVSGIDAVVKVCERREVGSFCLLGVQRVIGFPVRTAADLCGMSSEGGLAVGEIGTDRLEIVSTVEAEHIRWGGFAVVDHAECGFPGCRDGHLFHIAVADDVDAFDGVLGLETAEHLALGAHMQDGGSVCQLVHIVDIVFLDDAAARGVRVFAGDEIGFTESTKGVTRLCRWCPYHYRLFL